MDDQQYLEADFDPATLTVPRLRSILVAHNITYPSSAKKQQLIELFNDNVVPQARKLKSASQRVKRTSRGIEDITTGRKGTGAGDYDDDEIPPTPATGRSTRRSTRARTEEVVDVDPTPRSIRHSTAPPEGVTPRPRSVSRKHARQTETIREEEPEYKRQEPRSRQSVATPVAKHEAGNDDSPFSNENIFQGRQSGGVTPAARAPDTDRRRTTLGSTARDLDRRNRELRRRTEGISPAKQQTVSAVVPSRKTFNLQVSNVKDEELEPTEEFTPEEQHDLVHAQVAGELVPARRQIARPSSGAKRGLGVVLLTMAAGLAGVWRQEKLNVGYCGVGTPSTELAGVEVPPWAETIRPQCEPCPPHAICTEFLATECDSGFVLTQHPLSLGGLVPIPPTCEPDSAKARKVNMVKERAVEALREQNAKYECGEAEAPEIKETALKQAISTKRRKGMSNEEFADLWASAIPEIVDTDEVVSGSDGFAATPGPDTQPSAPTASLPSHSPAQSDDRYAKRLDSTYTKYRITSGQETEAKAKQLASLALEKLSHQAALNAQDPDVYRENYMSVAQLRDDVLRDEFSATRRKKLWEKVQRKVEGNANVRPMVREGRTGDVGRVWEWVGAVGLLESPPQSEKRRQSGRVSFAPTRDRLIEPSEDFSENALTRTESKPKTSRWEEGRSYY